MTFLDASSNTKYVTPSKTRAEMEIAGSIFAEAGERRLVALLGLVITVDGVRALHRQFADLPKPGFDLRARLQHPHAVKLRYRPPNGVLAISTGSPGRVNMIKPSPMPKM